jgi:hypothetical protein
MEQVSGHEQNMAENIIHQKYLILNGFQHTSTKKKLEIETAQEYWFI